MVDDKIYNFLLLYACLLELNSKFKMLLKHNVVYRLRINLRFKSSWIKTLFFLVSEKIDLKKNAEAVLQPNLLH